ncbi:MAG: zf-HC2 domain-containing protein [Actinobacteria bacterium]|nr:zf-HC2 domain-containing protein [Actinomycetota bacterium]
MRALAHFWTGSCHETAELLSARLENDVPLPLRGRVRRHLARCAACRAVLRSLERVVAELRTLRRDDEATFPSVADAVVARIRRDELGASR